MNLRINGKHRLEAPPNENPTTGRPKKVIPPEESIHSLCLYITGRIHLIASLEQPLVDKAYLIYFIDLTYRISNATIVGRKDRAYSHDPSF